MTRELDDETERGEYERMRHTDTQKFRNVAHALRKKPGLGASQRRPEGRLKACPTMARTSSPAPKRANIPGGRMSGIGGMVPAGAVKAGYRA